MKHQFFAFIIGMFCSIAFINCQTTETKSTSLISEEINSHAAAPLYKTYCATCHGQNLERFAGYQMQFGNTKTELIKTIKEGRLTVGMPAFAGALSDSEITQLSDLVLIGNKLSVADENKFSSVIKSDELSFAIDTVIGGLDVPWGMTFLPTGDLLITERSGKLLRYRDGKKQATIAGLPTDIFVQGQGGLLDIELHPDYLSNNWIYITYSKQSAQANSIGNTAVIRAKLVNDQLTETQLLFYGEPQTNKGQHFGSRIVFDNENHIYFSVGERGEQTNAQLLTNDNGKVHRLNDDGSVPSDNPFINQPNARKTIYSYGHRNIQGIAYDKVKNILWTNEHGPKGGDELNIDVKGKNYGWPVITYGINYNGTIITNETSRPDMEQPVYFWVPSIAPSSMLLITSNRYPKWNGDFLIGSLSFKNLERIRTEGSKMIKREILLENAGRIRNVVQGLDGYIYIATEKPGRILRIVPLNN